MGVHAAAHGAVSTHANAGTRAQVDPHLSRSVVVSTKLDTRLPQFARGHDVELFLRPPGRLLEPGMLGGCPFFTCALTLNPKIKYEYI